jgi:hypothetical protein
MAGLESGGYGGLQRDSEILLKILKKDQIVWFIVVISYE